jgi:molybdate transport system substrate-binding protein
MKIIRLVALALTTFAIPLIDAGLTEAAEIRVIANPGMKPVFEELLPQFEQSTGHKIVVQYGLFNQLKGPIDAGEFDMAVTTGQVVEYLTKQNKFANGTRADIARVAIGVAIRAGAPKPDISTTEAFKRALLSAKSISYTKGSSAGTYLASLMERLGIAEEMKTKTKLMGGGGQNPKAVAAGEVELGLSIIPDIVAVPGVEVLGPLPQELQHYIVETAGVGAAVKDHTAADALLAFLKGPFAAAVFNAKGFEPISR